MNINTILVHVADDDECAKRLKVAKALARDYKAHLTAVFIPTPFNRRSVGRAASATLLAEMTKSARERLLAAKAEFESVCKDWKISHSWHEEEGDHLSILEDHARAADLMIVSQSHVVNLEDRFRLLLSEELVMISGVPVLVVPEAWEPDAIGETVLIAWKSTRECVRAVRDSLAILQQAKQVTVLTVGSAEQTGRLPADQVINYLNRHNVKATHRRDYDEDTDVGNVILKVAADESSDLIVMGAYGRKRTWRSMLLGRATRVVSRQTTVPTIFSH